MQSLLHTELPPGNRRTYCPYCNSIPQNPSVWTEKVAPMTRPAPSDRSRVRRIPDRARYDEESIYSIVDEALFCHIGFVVDGRPFVIPTIHARDQDRLLFHGAKASRLLKHIQAGNEICATVTLVDGLVLARSVFHHSMNYRSAVLYGHGELVTDRDEKMRCLGVLSEHLIPGRWDNARRPNDKELAATSVIAMQIEDASAKIRSGPAKDDEDDYGLPFWAGVLPLELVAGAPQPDDRLASSIPIPGYVQDYSRLRTHKE